jgi:uncharacterized protein (TIGR03435 family)
MRAGSYRPWFYKEDHPTMFATLIYRLALELTSPRRCLLRLLFVPVAVLFGLLHLHPARAQATAPNPPQSIADTWQGTLHAGQDLRTVIKISKAEGGGYKAQFYSIDQMGGDSVPVTKITLEGSTVKMSLTMFGGTYEGKLSADGKMINGEWTQGGKPIPLNLARATPETEWTIPPPRPKIPPMDASIDPNFEVATIKPNDSDGPSLKGLNVNGRNFKTVNSSLGDLIRFSYELQAKQVLNGPDWLDKDRYDIAAVPEQEGVPNTEQLRIMIRKLLADRFKLTFHKDKRELPAYVLTIAKNGQKIKPTEMQGPLPGFGFHPGTGGITMVARNTTVKELAGFLQVLILDRPVVDQTNLAGHYDMECTFTPDDSLFNGHSPFPPQPDANNTAPSFYEAFQQDLGLKLSPEKAPVDVIVIDHVEKPTQN